jgi:hypothetical protein
VRKALPMKRWMAYWVAIHRDGYEVPVTVGPIMASNEACAKIESGSYLIGFSLKFLRVEIVMSQDTEDQECDLCRLGSTMHSHIGSGGANKQECDLCRLGSTTHSHIGSGGADKQERKS